MSNNCIQNTSFKNLPYPYKYHKTKTKKSVSHVEKKHDIKEP